MAVTENTYTGNGSTVLYSFTFPYLAATDIKVSVNGTLTTAYTLANATTVQFNSAPANGAAIRIYRSTSDATKKATFFPGSSIRATDLNDDFDQVLYLAQETANFAASTDASAIQATANTALANSNTAISTANAASATANGIAGTANTALSNSNTAVSTATAAQSTASAAQAVANAALPLLGGTMTGNITFNGGQTFPNVLSLSGGTLTGGLTIPSLNGGYLSGVRNRIINGDMQLDQRNSGTAVTVGSRIYTLDRWIVGNDNSAVMTASQSSTVPSGSGFSKSLLATVTTATVNPIGPASRVFIEQPIEGYNVSDFNLGSASAKQFTLSFWVRSSIAGTYTVAFQNPTYAGTIRSYVSSYTISAANTWEYKTITLTGDTSGTWENTVGQGLRIIWCLAAGSSSRTGSPNTWVNGNLISVSSAVDFTATNGSTFYLTGVQVEIGPTATPFERRSYGQELAMAQRYYQFGNSTLPGSSFISHWFKATMRVAPNMTTTAGTLANITVDKFRTDSGATISDFNWTASAEL
jgi:hypothetical protein